MVALLAFVLDESSPPTLELTIFQAFWLTFDFQRKFAA